MTQNNYKKLMSGLVALSIVSACGEEQKPAKTGSPQTDVQTAQGNQPSAPAEGAPKNDEAKGNSDQANGNGVVNFVTKSEAKAASALVPSLSLKDRMMANQVKSEMAKKAVKEMRQRVQESIDAKESANVLIPAGLLAIGMGGTSLAWSINKTRSIPNVPNAFEAQVMVLHQQPDLNPYNLKYSQVLAQVENQFNGASADAKLTIEVFDKKYENMTRGQITNDLWIRIGNKAETLKITMPKEIVDRMSPSDRLHARSDNGLFIDDAKRREAMTREWTKAIDNHAVNEYRALQQKNANFLERAVTRKITSITKEARGKKVASLTLLGAAGLLITGGVIVDATGLYFVCQVEDLPVLEAQLAKLEQELKTVELELNADTAELQSQSVIENITNEMAVK
jgi:hypothetical protein